MKSTPIKRKFVFVTGKNNEIELQDINPKFTAEQIRQHYTPLYPELTNANVNDKGIVLGENRIEFSSIVGTKG